MPRNSNVPWVQLTSTPAVQQQGNSPTELALAQSKHQFVLLGQARSEFEAFYGSFPNCEPTVCEFSIDVMDLVRDTGYVPTNWAVGLQTQQIRWKQSERAETVVDSTFRPGKKEPKTDVKYANANCNCRVSLTDKLNVNECIHNKQRHSFDFRI